MREGAQDMLLDHADRDTEFVRDLTVGITFDLVHDESRAAGVRQFVQQHRKRGDLVAKLQPL
ncbi:hypothetical protein D3C72_2549450 [compost metagenome]